MALNLGRTCDEKAISSSFRLISSAIANLMFALRVDSLTISVDVTSDVKRCANDLWLLSGFFENEVVGGDVNSEVNSLLMKLLVDLYNGFFVILILTQDDILRFWRNFRVDGKIVPENSFIPVFSGWWRFFDFLRILKKMFAEKSKNCLLQIPEKIHKFIQATEICWRASPCGIHNGNCFFVYVQEKCRKYP